MKLRVFLEMLKQQDQWDVSVGRGACWQAEHHSSTISRTSLSKRENWFPQVALWSPHAHLPTPINKGQVIFLRKKTTCVLRTFHTYRQNSLFLLQAANTLPNQNLHVSRSQMSQMCGRFLFQCMEEVPRSCKCSSIRNKLELPSQGMPANPRGSLLHRTRDLCSWSAQVLSPLMEFLTLSG